MSGGKAHGQNREYQFACRNVLMFRDKNLVPWESDGIDVEFTLPDTKWTVDIALRRNPRGDLLVAECRRTEGAVKQEDMAALAYKVEQLRRSLAVRVAGVFMAKKSHQLGAVKVGQFNGIEVVILPEGADPPGFNITFLQYDAEREVKLRNIVMLAAPGRYTLTGFPVTLRHNKSSGGSEQQ